MHAFQDFLGLPILFRSDTLCRVSYLRYRCCTGVFIGDSECPQDGTRVYLLNLTVVSSPAPFRPYNKQCCLAVEIDMVAYVPSIGMVINKRGNYSYDVSYRANYNGCFLSIISHIHGKVFSAKSSFFMFTIKFMVVVL